MTKFRHKWKRILQNFCLDIIFATSRGNKVFIVTYKFHNPLIP